MRSAHAKSVPSLHRHAVARCHVQSHCLHWVPDQLATYLQDLMQLSKSATLRHHRDAVVLPACVQPGHPHLRTTHAAHAA